MGCLYDTKLHALVRWLFLKFEESASLEPEVVASGYFLFIGQKHLLENC